MTVRTDAQSRARTTVTWPVWTRLALTSADLDAAEAQLGGERRLQRRWNSLRHRILSGTGFPPLDRWKRWDEANVVEILAASRQPVDLLDCGAYNSPALWAASRRGKGRMDGIDLNPRLPISPRSGRIRYSCQNMMSTAFINDAFDMIVSGSTIEHGVDWRLFLEESHRLLRTGGLLYVSTDVVHPSVDTSDLVAFGLPWTPLRPRQVADMTKVFEDHGFTAATIEAPALPERLPMSFLGVDIGFVAFAVTAV